MDWKIGDAVIYGNNGICRITDIQRMRLTEDGEKTYYILEPLYRARMTIYVDQKRGAESFRHPLTVAEIDGLIASIRDQEWIANEKERQMQNASRIHGGKYSDLLSIISTLYKKDAERRSIGRKLSAADERDRDAAESIISQSFAYSLGIRPDEVPDYIRRRAEK